MTLLTNDGFLAGALVLGEMLKRVGSCYPFVVSLGPAVSEQADAAIEAFGFQTHRMKTDSIDKGEGLKQQGHRWESTVQKLCLVGLDAFEKVVFLNADVAVLNNLDGLFERPHMSAVRTRALQDNGRYAFNSGVMVLEPNAADLVRCLEQLPRTAERFVSEGRPWGDQNVFNDTFHDWDTRPELHLEDGYNVFWGSIDDYVARRGFSASREARDEERISIVHFTGPHKPWVEKTSFALKSAIRPLRHLKRPPTREAMSILHDYFRMVRKVEQRIDRFEAHLLMGGYEGTASN